MIGGFALLLVFQLAGELLARLFDLAVPGPVLGMLLLFLVLLGREDTPRTLRGPAHGLLGNLSLLFVPAGVGVMLHFGRIAEEWLPILVALVLSTAVTIAVTALAMRAAMRRSADGP